MSVIVSLLLGLVQGIAEFLPISSSGHLSILTNLFNLKYSEDDNLLFEVLLHLGTLIAVFVVYWKDIKAMVSDGVEFLRKRSDPDPDEPAVLKPSARALLFVIVGTIPLLIPMIFNNSISRLFSNTIFIGFALLITGGLLFVSDRYIKRGQKTEKSMTMGDAVIIGLSQAVAVIPGLSRSGTTIAVGLARGLSGTFAVRFSLLLSIPAVLGSTVLVLFKSIKEGINFSLFPTYLAGFVVAAIVGFFSIQIIRRVMAKTGLGKFSYYCWAVGVLTIILSLVL